VEELDRSDLIAFRDRLIAEGFVNWTVESNGCRQSSGTCANNH
jgi:hypothetical protein